MNESRLIFSQRCWWKNRLQPATVVIEKSKITAVLDHQVNGAEDAGTDILMPGIIDTHVHINEPGRVNWEGFDTATRAAAAGGITTLIEMPLNADPVTTSLENFHAKIKATTNKLHVNVGFYGGLVPGNTDQLERMIRAGVWGIKCFLTHSGIDEFPKVTETDLEKAMPILSNYDIPLLVHCELESECSHELDLFPTQYKAYLASRPKKWENDAIAMMIRLCRKYHCRVHIVHVSSAEALLLIEEAKKEGLLLTAETCAHYLFFDAAHIPDASCIYKCAPPIREKENNEKLISALLNGVLDFITSDHSPAPPEIKELESGNLQKAWGGIAGLQFLLSASWTSLKDRMSLEQFIPLLTEKPATFLNIINRGRIEPGALADLLIWNPDQSMTIRKEDILFRHKISPYIGKEVFGIVKQTIVDGETVFKDDRFLIENKGIVLRKVS